MTKLRNVLCVGCVILVCVGFMCACNKQNNKITDQIFPNTVVENSKIDSKYKDVAYELSEDGIKEFYEIDKVPRVSGHTEAMRNYQSKLKMNLLNSEKHLFLCINAVITASCLDVGILK